MRRPSPRYVAIRDAGRDPLGRVRRPRSTDPFLPKIEEWVDRSRTTRRAVAEAKVLWRAGNRRSYRPWVPEPGLWIQVDWGEGPRVGGRRTQLFCAWLAWSRFRVAIPAWAQTLGTLVACLDAMLRRIGGVATYLLTDNPRTVTIDRVAGVPVRHPDIVAAGRHYGCTVHTCEPFDPQSKGGVEHTVKVAKADLVPTEANLLPAYGSFIDLVDACVQWCERVNARPHRETKAAPVDRLIVERRHLHPVPAQPHAIALGEERLVDDDQTIRFGSVRCPGSAGYAGGPGRAGSPSSRGRRPGTSVGPRLNRRVVRTRAAAPCGGHVRLHRRRERSFQRRCSRGSGVGQR